MCVLICWLVFQFRFLLVTVAADVTFGSCKGPSGLMRMFLFIDLRAMELEYRRGASCSKLSMFLVDISTDYSDMI